MGDNAAKKKKKKTKEGKRLLRLHEEPAWRWLRARELVEHKTKPRNWHDDETVKRAYVYLMKVDKMNPRTMRDASIRWPIVHDAFQIWDNKKNGKGSRWIYEAAVMAKVSPEEMSEYLQIDVKTLELYEELFFDVRCRLSHPGWVNANLLHAAHSEGVSKFNTDQAWKEIAYNGGWDIVRSMWEFGSASASVQDFLVSAFRNKLMVAGLSAVSTTQANAFNAVDIMRLAFDMMKHDVETGTQVARDKTQAAMGEVLRSVKLQVISAMETTPRVEPRRQRQLPPPNIFEQSRRTKADDEIAKLAEATIKGVSDGESD